MNARYYAKIGESNKTYFVIWLIKVISTAEISIEDSYASIISYFSFTVFYDWWLQALIK